MQTYQAAHGISPSLNAIPDEQRARLCGNLDHILLIGICFFMAGTEPDRSGVLSQEIKPFRCDAGFNWENVNKRILPQVIYKGHVLRRERKCRKGLYFVTPKAVTDRIRARVGDGLMSYQPQPGSVTFHSYSLGAIGSNGRMTLCFDGAFTTTIDQLALAFSSPTNLPNQGVFEAAILAALRDSVSG